MSALRAFCLLPAYRHRVRALAACLRGDPAVSLHASSTGAMAPLTASSALDRTVSSRHPANLAFSGASHTCPARPDQKRTTTPALFPGGHIKGGGAISGRYGHPRLDPGPTQRNTAPVRHLAGVRDSTSLLQVRARACRS